MLVYASNALNDYMGLGVGLFCDFFFAHFIKNLNTYMCLTEGVGPRTKFVEITCTFRFGNPCRGCLLGDVPQLTAFASTAPSACCSF